MVLVGVVGAAVVGAAALLVVGIATGTGTGTDHEAGDRIEPRGEDHVIEDPSDEAVAAAVAAGELVLPEGADVRALSSDDDRGWRHRLVVELAPGGEQAFLAASGFAVPLRPVTGLTFATVDGYEPPTDRQLLYGQDSLGGSATPVAYREVAVDRSDPARTIVHVFLWQA